MEDITPLPHEWMIVSIIGFFVSWLQVYGYWSKVWGFTFMLFFLILFVATVVNMEQLGTHETHLAELAIHEKRRR